MEDQPLVVPVLLNVWVAWVWRERASPEVRRVVRRIVRDANAIGDFEGRKMLNGVEISWGCLGYALFYTLFPKVVTWLHADRRYYKLKYMRRAVS